MGCAGVWLTAAGVSHTLSLRGGCLGRSPGSQLGSGHEGPNTQLCPGGQTKGDVTVEDMKNRRRFGNSNLKILEKCSEN